MHDIEAKVTQKGEIPLTKQIEVKINYWDYIKLKSFCSKGIADLDTDYQQNGRNYSPNNFVIRG